MSVGFGATFGTGTSDRLDYSFTIFANWSMAFWYFSWATPSVQIGRILTDENTSGIFGNVLHNNASGKLQLGRQTTGTTWEWGFDDSYRVGIWTHIAITQSGTDTPRYYLNGREHTVTLVTTGSGSADTGASTVYIGGRSDTTRTWDGLLAEWGYWARVLTATEVRDVMVNGLTKRTVVNVHRYFPYRTHFNSPSLSVVPSATRGGPIPRRPWPPIAGRLLVNTGLQNAFVRRRAPLFSAVDEDRPSQTDNLLLTAGDAPYLAQLGNLSTPTDGRVRLELDAGWTP